MPKATAIKFSPSTYCVNLGSLSNLQFIQVPATGGYSGQSCSLIFLKNFKNFSRPEFVSSVTKKNAVVKTAFERADASLIGGETLAAQAIRIE